MAQWKVGDDVILKSGGPTMTVKALKADDMVFCEWFDGKNTPQGHVFHADMLKSPPESGTRTLSRA